MEATASQHQQLHAVLLATLGSNPNVSLEPFSSLEEIDLLSLQFSEQQFKHIVEELASFPNLHSLSIHLSEEEQVDFVVTLMPTLQNLNGIPVDREEFEEEEEDVGRTGLPVEIEQIQERDAELEDDREESEESDDDIRREEAVREQSQEEDVTEMEIIGASIAKEDLKSPPADHSKSEDQFSKVRVSQNRIKGFLSPEEAFASPGSQNKQDLGGRQLDGTSSASPNPSEKRTVIERLQTQEPELSSAFAHTGFNEQIPDPTSFPAGTLPPNPARSKIPELGEAQGTNTYPQQPRAAQSPQACFDPRCQSEKQEQAERSDFLESQLEEMKLIVESQKLQITSLEEQLNNRHFETNYHPSKTPLPAADPTSFASRSKSPFSRREPVLGSYRSSYEKVSARKPARTRAVAGDELNHEGKQINLITSGVVQSSPESPEHNPDLPQLEQVPQLTLEEVVAPLTEMKPLNTERPVQKKIPQSAPRSARQLQLGNRGAMPLLTTNPRSGTAPYGSGPAQTKKTPAHYINSTNQTNSTLKSGEGSQLHKKTATASSSSQRHTPVRQRQMKARPGQDSVNAKIAEHLKSKFSRGHYSGQSGSSLFSRKSTITSSQSIQSSGPRMLSQKQLKDMIADIYSSKIKFDKKCQQSKQPRETMEQFMYTYLNQKYGLKSLIVDYAQAITKGIQKFREADHDVVLFGKILKNQCDEEFRFIQAHVKDNLASMVKQLLKEKNPFKMEVDLNKMVEQVQSGYVDEYIWKRIIEHMYEGEDVEHLIASIALKVQFKDGGLKNYLNGPSEQQQKHHGRKLTRAEQNALTSVQKQPRLLFSDFQKVILDFQLEEHERFLNKFTAIFAEIDQSKTGVLNEDQFRSLLDIMGVITNPEEISSLLAKVDPFNNQKMTYSEIVSLFSAYLVPSEPFDYGSDARMPMLEKFSLLQEMKEEGIDQEMFASCRKQHLDEEKKKLSREQPDQEPLDKTLEKGDHDEAERLNNELVVDPQALAGELNYVSEQHRKDSSREKASIQQQQPVPRRSFPFGKQPAGVLQPMLDSTRMDLSPSKKTMIDETTVNAEIIERESILNDQVYGLVQQNLREALLKEQ